MRYILTFFALLAISVFASGDVGIEGIKIGDTSTALEKLGPTSAVDKRGDIEIRKYKLKDGNELSVTLKSARVVYIENDWSQDEKANKSPYDGLVFGKTTLNEVRSRFGSNGFTYEKTAFVKNGAGLIAFNCYEIVDTESTVLVVVNKVLPKPGITALNLGDHFKLDAVIIADPKFLDEIWGIEKRYDPAYKKVSLSKI